MSHAPQLVAERYRLTSVIGSGGMGRVWLARDEVLRRNVAVKEVVLPEDMTFAERNELCQRTLREARAAGRLSHPNVVAVYDVVQAEGRPWIVMELVKSRSLYQVVKEDGPIAPRRAAEIGLAVLAALQAAHKAGVWHRDVKPGNVLLAEDGRVVLTDFGLATFEGDGTVTRAGVILGSAQYISPERARDGASGPEADMWSLGATLYAAVEGRAPYARETPMATLTALATAPPDTPRRAGPLRPVLIGLLRKNPRHRMRAQEVERLLTRIVAGEARGRRGLLAPRQRNADLLAPEEAVTFVTGAAVALDTAPDAPAGAGLAIGSALQSPEAPAVTGTGNGRPPWEQGDNGVLIGDTAGAGGRLAGDRLHTVTEETMRHQPGRRRNWPWALGVLVVVVAVSVPTVAYLRDAEHQNQNGDVATPTSTASPAPVLTAAMGVQACLNQLPDRETQVPVGPGDALQDWTFFRDPAGFALQVPLGWVTSQIGTLRCLRDPTSVKTISVLDLGGLQGDTRQLVNDTDAWQNAAGLTGYTPLGVKDLLLPDNGGAVLEYTYQRAGIKMHGQNEMIRLQGRLFVLGLLTADSSWSTDRDLFNAAAASFSLAP